MISYLKELYKFRELLFSLTKREIKVRYKQTTLGAAWAILQPFSLMLIFSLVFGVLLKLESDSIPYPIFYYSALLPWTFFSTSFSFGALAIINNSSLITKIYFPRETIPLASVGAAILDLTVASLIFLLMMIFYKTPLTFQFIYVLPIIVILVIFTTAMVLLSSALVVIWRDLKFVIPLAIQIWMFASPIIYPLSQVPEGLKGIYMLNPMAVLINNFRKITVGGDAANWQELSLAAIVSIILFILCYLFFKQKEKIFADII